MDRRCVQGGHCVLDEKAKADSADALAQRERSPNPDHEKAAREIVRRFFGNNGDQNSN